MQWKGDQYGTAVIRPLDGDGFAWVSPRRSYCDRGHWDWGFQSLAPLPGVPSYYFMELATAIEEVSQWLAQSPPSGALIADRPLLAVNPAGLACPTGRENPPTWQSRPDGSIVCDVENGAERMTLSIRPVDDGFEFNLQGLACIDEADRFPRLYRNAASAMREAGLFAQWRLGKVPAQVPGPVGIDFSHVLEGPISSAIAENAAPATARPGFRR